VNGKEVALNDFVQRVFSGMIAGAVTSLRNVEQNWKEIRIEVIKAAG
jgi:hypothetical protein